MKVELIFLKYKFKVYVLNTFDIIFYNNDNLRSLSFK